MSVFISDYFLDQNNLKSKYQCKNQFIYIVDFEAIQKTRSHVLSSVKTLCFASINLIIHSCWFFKQYIEHYMAAWIQKKIQKYFTQSLRSLVKDFSTLEEKFHFSVQACNILYLSRIVWHNLCMMLDIMSVASCKDCIPRCTMFRPDFDLFTAKSSSS